MKSCFHAVVQDMKQEIRMVSAQTFQETDTAEHLVFFGPVRAQFDHWSHFYQHYILTSVLKLVGWIIRQISLRKPVHWLSGTAVHFSTGFKIMGWWNDSHALAVSRERWGFWFRSMRLHNADDDWVLPVSNLQTEWSSEISCQPTRCNNEACQHSWNGRFQHIREAHAHTSA